MLNNSSNPDIVTTHLTHLFVPASPAGLLYDPDGNLTNDGHFTYTRNSENQITSVVSLTNTPANSKRKLTFGALSQSTKGRGFTSLFHLSTSRSLMSRAVSWNILPLATVLVAPC